MYLNFLEDDIIIVTSLSIRILPVSAVFCLPVLRERCTSSTSNPVYIISGINVSSLNLSVKFILNIYLIYYMVRQHEII